MLLDVLAPALLLSTGAAANSIPLLNSAYFLMENLGIVSYPAVQMNIDRTRAKFTANAVNLDRNFALGVPLLDDLIRKRSNPGVRRGSTAAIPLAWQGPLWTGPISVGTPPQQFQVDLDTGSTDWILCGAAACSNNNARHEYDTAASSTSVATGQNFTNAYGDGSSTSGTVYRDTVQFGTLAAVNQPINVASSMGGVVASITADGIMGMAFSAISGNTGGLALPDNLHKGNVISSNTFSFRLSTTPGVSECFVGGWNKEKFTGPITWHDIAPDMEKKVFTYLQMKNSSAIVNGEQVVGTTSTYILDTGSTLIIAPRSAAMSFWASVPGSRALSGPQLGYYSFPCASPPRVAFTFASNATRSYSVAPEDFSVGKVQGSSTQCLGAVVRANSGVGDAWILGDAFLKNQYTVFNLTAKKIGFAQPV